MRHPLKCVTWIGAAIVMTALTGCASAPQFRYYTIDMQPRAQVTAPVRFVNLRINVNQALQRPEILIRTSPTQVEYYALDRWASGLEEQIAEKLRTEFANPAPGAHPLNVECTLMGFEQVDTGTGANVRVKIEVVVQAIEFQKVYLREMPANSSTAGAVVEALSRATEAIAADLAKDLASYFENTSTN